MKKIDRDFEKILHAYLDAVIFTEGYNTEDENRYSCFSADAIAYARADLITFMGANRELIQQYIERGLTYDSLAHNFWLTRNNHPSHFFDCTLGDLGLNLVRASRAIGAIELLEDDEGRIHFAPPPPSHKSKIGQKG